MPRAKEYKGRLVKNRRYSNAKMHLVADYRRNGETVGIYSDAFDKFVGILKKRIKRQQQNVVVVEGDTGAGKSTFAIQLCLALAKELHVDFNLKNDYVYSLDDLWVKLRAENPSPISLFDEGAVTLASSNSQRRQDKDMVSLFNTMRSRGWTTVICIPSIWHLNKAVRAVHCDFKCRCNSPEHPLIKDYSRGFVEISQAQRYEYAKGDDPYWYLLFTGIFSDIPDRIKTQYLPIKAGKQDELVNDIITRAEAEKADEHRKVNKLLKKEGVEN